jgi:hypothetical protein
LAVFASLATEGTLVSRGSSDAGFQSLFNGRDLTGWDGDPAVWSVRDGAITGQTSEQKIVQENTFLVWNGGEPANFELHASFRLVAKNEKHFANSGLYYRSRFDVATKQVLGYQGDMDASLKDYLGAMYEDDRTTIAKFGQRIHATRVDGKSKLEVTGATASGADLDALFAELSAGHWLNYTIIAKGNHIQHYVNGKLAVDVTDDDDERSQSGVIALQVHHGPAMLVQFKNIQIKLLPQ